MEPSDLLSRIDDKKRCSACEEGDRYVATYIGPFYRQAKFKILFIGLNAGGGDSQSYDLRQRQEAVLDYYKDNNWNQQYRGCVRITSYILGSGCLTRCSSRCTPTESSDCALRSFAQGNAVKCVSSDATDMKFRGGNRIASCLPLVFDEMPDLQPEVIVLLGKGDLPEPFFDCLAATGGRREPTDLQQLSIIRWENGSPRSMVISSKVPAYGNLDKDWERETTPALDLALRLLS